MTTLKKEKIATEEFSRRLIHSQEEERKRIASELHDSLGQELLIIKNRASLGLAKNDKDILITQMKEISNTASNSIDVVRQIAYNLHPYQIDRLGLTKAILSILDQVKSLTSIDVKESIEDVDS
ncbi:MAG: histidine kinase, partial [Ignavibacteriaceae bacterium]